MGSFGNAVSSLLDAYTRCLSLLKHSDPGCLRAESAKLRRSIRADRSRVQSAYESRSSLQDESIDGDAAAKSLLRKVIKRLKAAVGYIIDVVAGGQQPRLNYDSLRALSKSTRIDAVTAIEGLSGHLGSAPSPGCKAASRESTFGRRNSSSVSSMRTAVSASRSKRATTGGRSKQHNVARQRAHPRTSTTQRLDSSIGARKTLSRDTTRSDSTKMGEISGRAKLRRRGSLVQTEISTKHTPQPTYPLRPYTTKAKPKSKRFWRIFGGS